MVAIFQLKENCKDRHYKIFEGYERVVSRFGKVNPDDYDLVWCGDLDNTLEEIYMMFNVDRPLGFKGHSLSVSDLIFKDGEMWYVDIFGFTKLED